MVALPNEPPNRTEHGPIGPFAALFLAWRRLVTSALRVLARVGRGLAASRPARAASVAARYVRDPAGTLASASADERARLKEAGAFALALGVAVSFLVPEPIALPVVRRFLGAGWIAAWALARLFIMRSVATGALARRRASIDDAWGPALLPYAFAVFEPLPLVAFALSALLTMRGLRALGAERAEARRVVWIAFGLQAAAEIASWLARGGLVYLLAIRG
jgi:hypothetical protein